MYANFYVLGAAYLAAVIARLFPHGSDAFECKSKFPK
jgi:hypothetical protein